MPEDESGAPDPQAVAAIRADIKTMHLVLLGENLDDDDPALDETYQLWVDVWKAGRARVQSGAEGQTPTGRCRATRDYDTEVNFPPAGTEGEPRTQFVADPDYTLRAWQAVMTYLLSDYRFLFE